MIHRDVYRKVQKGIWLTGMFFFLAVFQNMAFCQDAPSPAVSDQLAEKADFDQTEVVLEIRDEASSDTAAITIEGNEQADTDLLEQSAVNKGDDSVEELNHKPDQPPDISKEEKAAIE